METITVNKEALLSAVRANRDNHRAEFLKAQDGWRDTIIEELDRRLKDARQGKRVLSAFSFPEPQDHTRDYDRIIQMLIMEVADVIKIPERDFAQYVMDDWDWKAVWTATNTAYITKRS